MCNPSFHIYIFEGLFSVSAREFGCIIYWFRFLISNCSAGAPSNKPLVFSSVCVLFGFTTVTYPLIPIYLFNISTVIQSMKRQKHCGRFFISAIVSFYKKYNFLFKLSQNSRKVLKFISCSWILARGDKRSGVIF